jgi:hypothetical protein
VCLVDIFFTTLALLKIAFIAPLSSIVNRNSEANPPIIMGVNLDDSWGEMVIIVVKSGSFHYLKEVRTTFVTDTFSYIKHSSVIIRIVRETASSMFVKSFG